MVAQANMAIGSHLAKSGFVAHATEVNRRLAQLRIVLHSILTISSCKASRLPGFH